MVSSGLHELLTFAFAVSYCCYARSGLGEHYSSLCSGIELQEHQDCDCFSGALDVHLTQDDRDCLALVCASGMKVKILQMLDI